MKKTSNDKNTFDALYDKYADKVYRVALSSSGNRETAEDIMQTVFMKLYQHMSNINTDNVESWLMIVAKNQAMDYIRKYKGERLFDDIEACVEEYGDEIDKDMFLVESLEDSMIRKLTIQQRAEFAYKIYSKLYEKDKRWHEAIMATYILERPQKEVAETMGMSSNAFYLMMYRARNWVKKQYQKQYEHLEKI